MCHELGGSLVYLNFKLLDIAGGKATQIWSVLKFVIFIINPVLLYYILKNILNKQSILPQAIAIIYLVSPVITNLCTLEFVRRLYLGSFLLSILFSVKAASKNKFKLHYYVLSIFLLSFSVLGMESYIFVEVCRPVIIFYVLYKITNDSFLTKAKKAIAHWLPFIAIAMFVFIRNTGILIPRSGIYADIYKVEHKSIFQIISNYITALRYIFVDNLSHFASGLGSINEDFFMMLMAIVAAALAICIILKKSSTASNVKENVRLNEALLTAGFGLFLVFVGLFPYIIVRSFPAFGIQSRHALEANVGAAIFIPSLLGVLYYKGLFKKQFGYFLFGAIVFVGVFECNATIKAYNNDWEQQRSFWWQFMWRVPDIKDGTYLLVDMPREESDYFDVWRGLGEFACPLNMLYAKSSDKKEVDNHFAQSFDYTAFYKTAEQFYLDNMDKEAVEYDCYKGTVRYYPPKLMLTSYKDGYLYLNHEVDNSNSTRTVNVTPLKTKIADEQIIYDSTNNEFPYRWLLGPEPDKTGPETVMDKITNKMFNERKMLKDWRYYRQKVKLAEELKDYDQIVKLYDEAESLELVPDLSESIPLCIIKAFYITGRIDKANTLLKTWAFSLDASAEKALSLTESAEIINNANLNIAIKKQIEHIWGGPAVPKKSE